MGNIIKFRPRRKQSGTSEKMRDCLLKRGKFFHYTYRENGRKVWKSTKQTTRQLARLWVDKHILQPKRDLALGIVPLKEATFEYYALNQFIPMIEVDIKPPTLVYYRSKLIAPMNFFKGKELSQITSEMINRYKKLRISALKKNGFKAKRTNTNKNEQEYISPNLINKELFVLSRLFNHAIEHGYLITSPMKGVKKLKERRYKARFISEEDFVNKFLPAANPTGRNGLTELYTLTFYLGLRSHEVRGTKWSEVDFNSRKIDIWDEKTHIWKHLPMNDFIHSMLKELKKDSKSDYVFVNQYGKKLGCARGGFTATLRRAGLPHMRFHDLRHSFVTNCAAKGFNWDATSQITGHKSYEMYSRYRHFFDTAAVKLVNSFEAPKTFISSKRQKQLKDKARKNKLLS